MLSCTMPRPSLAGLLSRRILLPLLVAWMAALAGCSGDPTAPPGEPRNPGAVTFGLVWDASPSAAANAYAPRLVTGDVCADYQIEWIYARAVDQRGIEQESATWPCTRRSGELNGLPVGLYRIVIQGAVAGQILWRGEVTEVQVRENQLTDAGRISMGHLYDQIPPVVATVVPADGATNVAVNTALTATFDNAIVTQSIGPENFTLTYVDDTGAQQAVPCTVSYEAGLHAAVLSPGAPLLEGTTYTASLAVDQALVVEDLAGNPMQAGFEWQFATSRPDLEAPTIQDRSPQHAEMDVAAPVTVQIEFSEPLLPATLTSTNFYLRYHGIPAFCDLIYDDRFNRVTLLPRDPLRAGTTYTVVVRTDVSDLAGNPLADEQSWSFVTQFPTWHLEEIGTLQANWSTALGLDVREAPVVSLQRSDEAAYLYARRTGPSAWDDVTLDSTQNAGRYHDLAMGDFDMHVAYSDQTNARLMYYSERFETGPAYSAVIDSGIDCQGVSLAVDTDDVAHMCYFDAGTSQLKYALVGSVEVIDTNAGQYPAITVTADGEAHVSYYDMTNGHLKYAVKAAGAAWAIETVDAGDTVGLHSAIALDDSDLPHISYFDEANADLKYAFKQPSGQWQIETVDSEGAVGRDTSIVLDDWGQAHISYLDSSHSALKYAVRTALGLWHLRIVDESGTTGAGSAIVLDSQEHIHISYCDWVNGSRARYATTRPQN